MAASVPGKRLRDRERDVLAGPPAGWGNTSRTPRAHDAARRWRRCSWRRATRPRSWSARCHGLEAQAVEFAGLAGWQPARRVRRRGRRCASGRTRASATATSAAAGTVETGSPTRIVLFRCGGEPCIQPIDTGYRTARRPGCRPRGQCGARATRARARAIAGAASRSVGLIAFPRSVPDGLFRAAAARAHPRRR